jgi:hypothetical protein
MVVFALIPAFVNAGNIFDFEWDASTWENSDELWQQMSGDNTVCNGYGLPNGAMCSNDSRFFIYSTRNNSNPQGWPRFGVFVPGEYPGVTGNSLGIIFTGGVGPDGKGGEVSYGLDVQSYDALIKAESIGGDVYADRNVPGAASIYYKALNSNARTLGVMSGSNRFSLYVWYPADEERYVRHSRNDRAAPNVPEKTLAWYPFIDSAGQDHYYHHATNRPSGGWIHYQFDAHPTHNNTGPYPENHAYLEGGFDSPHDGRDYFNRVAAFAVVFHAVADKPSPYTVLTDDWHAYYQPNENEETISNVGVGYDYVSKTFDISLEDKFRCDNCSGAYEVKFSFKPIDNNNYSTAQRVSFTENFFIEDDNTANNIIKPNNYYNQVWARVGLPGPDTDRFLSGERIYFALKDVSNRGVSLSNYDHEMVNKVKTIEFDYISPPEIPSVSIPSRIVIKERVNGGAYLAGNALNDIKISAPNELRAQYDGQAITFNAYETGDYNISIKGVRQHGERPAAASSIVSVIKTTCEDIHGCEYSGVADFTLETPTRYQEFNSVFGNKPQLNSTGVQLKAGENVGIAGLGFNVRSPDMIDIKVYSVFGGVVKLAITGEHAKRYSETSPASWFTFEPRYISIGEYAIFSVPATQLSIGLLHTINVSAVSGNAIVSNMGVRNQAALNCIDCDDMLVDFYASGSSHLTTISGWARVIQDKYTRKVGDGTGIAVGSNMAYNFQGVIGDVPMKDFDIARVHWVNEGVEAYSFTPLYSFYDSDRPVSGETGRWFSVGEIKLLPGQRYVQDVPGLKGKTIFNVNVNKNQFFALSVDKIVLR